MEMLETGQKYALHVFIRAAVNRNYTIPEQRDFNVTVSVYGRVLCIQIKTPAHTQAHGYIMKAWK